MSKITISEVESNTDDVIKNPNRQESGFYDSTPFHKKIKEQKNNQTSKQEVEGEPFIIMEDIQYYLFMDGMFLTSGDAIYIEGTITELIINSNKKVSSFRVLKQIPIKTGVFLNE